MLQVYMGIPVCSRCYSNGSSSGTCACTPSVRAVDMVNIDGRSFQCQNCVRVRGEAVVRMRMVSLLSLKVSSS